MKKLLLFFTLFLSLVMDAQKPMAVNPNLSPNGILEAVFDQYGNKYNLYDIKYQSERAPKSGVTTANAGYFQLYFETGCGMEGSSTDEAARRDTVIQVYKDISTFIPSPLTTNGLNNKVNIWVRNITNVPNVPSNVLGLATSFYNTPYNATAGFGGIADNEVWKTIHAGVDSYTNVTPPIYSGTTGVLYHGMMAFNFTSFPWNTNLGILANTGQYDLYTVVLHEVTHALGIVSLINENGVSQSGTGFNYFSRYDNFLYTSTGTKLISYASSTCSLYNYTFNSSALSALHPSASCQVNTTNCGTAIKFVTSTPGLSIPVYTPNCWETGSSLSHFEDSCFTAPTGFPNGNDAYFSMSNATPLGANKRYLKKEERLALLDLGYSVLGTFGVGTTYQGTPPAGHYGADAIGITVAGINDGLNGFNYSYIGEATTASPIIINSSSDPTKRILTNDVGANGFECLEDIYDGAAFISNTSGNATQDVSFRSTVPGLHLLRYIPVNTTSGQRGNITYIYVYVDISNCIPTACSMINNGGFENSTNCGTIEPIVVPTSPIVNCWEVLSFNPDLYKRGCSANSSTNQNFSIPVINNTPNVETWNNGLNSNNSMLGLGATVDVHEAIQTKLNAAIVPSTQYQLSFKVRVMNNFTNFTGIINQPTPIYFGGSVARVAVSPIINSLPPPLIQLASVTVPNNNKWNSYTVTLNATTATLNYLTIINAYKLGIPPDGTTDGTYVMIDDISVISLNGAAFTLPTPICTTQTIPDMRNYLSACPTTGVFTINGATSGTSFNAATAIVGNNEITYTYNNNLGCPITLTSNILVTASQITPTFTQVPQFCYGSNVEPLPTVSTNNVAGTWSPALNNTATTTYTFTPNPGLCATTTSMNITVLPRGSAGCPTTCPANLLFNTPAIVATSSYQVSDYIIANANYTVNSGSDILMTAQNYILLQANSYIRLGSLYQAKITPCIPGTGRHSGISDINKKFEVHLYPNPTHDSFTISSDEIQFSRIILSSIDGKIMYSQKVANETSFSFNVANFSKGMYIVTIETIDGQVVSKKLIKN